MCTMISSVVANWSRRMYVETNELTEVCMKPRVELITAIGTVAMLAD